VEEVLVAGELGGVLNNIPTFLGMLECWQGDFLGRYFGGGSDSEGRGGIKNAGHLGLGGGGRHLDILPNVLVSGYGVVSCSKGERLYGRLS